LADLEEMLIRWRNDVKREGIGKEKGQDRTEAAQRDDPRSTPSTSSFSNGPAWFALPTPQRGSCAVCGNRGARRNNVIHVGGEHGGAWLAGGFADGASCTKCRDSRRTGDGTTGRSYPVNPDKHRAPFALLRRSRLHGSEAIGHIRSHRRVHVKGRRDCVFVSKTT